MKKALSLLLAFVMVLSLVPMTVFAAAAPTIYFETNFTEDMTVGDTFYVTANLKDNVVFSTMTLSLKWNESAISFTGFNVDRRGGLDTEVYTYSAPVFNQKLGIVTGSDYLGYDTNGRIFTANFEIIAEEGDLGIGLKTADATEFEMLDLDDKDLGTIIDTSAINGLAVGGVSSGPEMPEDAPFTAITTDAGPIVAIEEADWVNGVPHYIVTIPADAETAYVTAPDQVVMEDWTTKELQATAYASVLTFDSDPLYISYDYEDTDDGPKVEIPMEMTVADVSGNGNVKLSFFSNDEYNPATHAFGIEDAGYSCLGWISFVYDDGLEEYNISIDENMVGGTIYACDEDGNEITKAIQARYYRSHGLQDCPAEENTQRATKHTQHNRFHQKLAEDGAAAGTDSLTNTDLTGTLGNGDQHDVHNTNTTDHQGDSCDTTQQNSQNRGDRTHGILQDTLGRNCKCIVIVLKTLHEQIRHGCFHSFHSTVLGSTDIERGNFAVQTVGKAKKAGIGQIHCQTAGGYHAGKAVLVIGENTHNGILHTVQTDCLLYAVHITNQFRGCGFIDHAHIGMVFYIGGLQEAAHSQLHALHIVKSRGCAINRHISAGFFTTSRYTGTGVRRN